MRSTMRRDDDAWSPVLIALLFLLLAILFFGLISPSQPPRALGVSIGLSPDGTNWTLSFVAVPTGLSQNATTLSLYSSGGSVLLGATTLYQLEGAGMSGVVYRPLQTGPSNTSCSAGDRVLILVSRYPSGTQYSIANGGSVLASGLLQ